MRRGGQTPGDERFWRKEWGELSDRVFLTWDEMEHDEFGCVLYEIGDVIALGGVWRRAEQ